MQEWFLNAIEYDERLREIPYHLEVLEYCRVNNLPVVVLEYKGCGPTVSILKDKVEILKDKSYIAKPKDDGFENTNLRQVLKEKHIETVLLMGINASACVMSTAAGAVMNGFKVMISKDLISDPKSYDRDESVSWYKDNTIYRDDYKELLCLLPKKKVDCSSADYY